MIMEFTVKDFYGKCLTFEGNIVGWEQEMVGVQEPPKATLTFRFKSVRGSNDPPTRIIKIPRMKLFIRISRAFSLYYGVAPVGNDSELTVKVYVRGTYDSYEEACAAEMEAIMKKEEDRK